MPPRIAPRRGGPRGGGNTPGGDRIDGAGRGSRPGGPSTAGEPDITSIHHVETVGVRRPGFGTAGRRFGVYVNAFEATLPKIRIFHYDVVEPEKLPARFNLDLITLMQDQYVSIFVPKVAYDGRKNIFSSHELALGDSHSRLFAVTLPKATGGNGGQPAHPPRTYHIKLTKVTSINPEVLRQYVDGQRSRDKTVLTSIMALNVVLRMAPRLQYPFNKSLFLMPQEQQPIGGMVLWRGIFQSFRPVIGRMIVNIDLGVGLMYKDGPLLGLCLEFLEIGPNVPMRELHLSPNNGLQELHRVRLQRFLIGLRVVSRHTGNQPRVIRGLSTQAANAISFTTHAGAQVTVAQYFQSLNIPLQFPTVICAQVGSTAMIPLEFCMVLPGQFMRKGIPDAKVVDVLEFTTKGPQRRLEIIKQRLVNLNHTGSDYVQSFGMTINSTPIAATARVLAHPPLYYVSDSKDPKVTADNIRNGAWNMVGKKFRKPATIDRWIVVVYETRSHFPDDAIADVVRRFLAACANVGVIVNNEDPLVKYHDGQQNVMKHLHDAGREHINRFNSRPSLFVVVLPNVGGDIYTAVKHFGDVVMGVATQCLRSSRCNRAKDQYWNNVMLKVNVKLGGINLVLADKSTLNDLAAATIVMGAHVSHPAPGRYQPSITALVGSVDSHGAKYVATSRAQTDRQEIIDDLKYMCKHILYKFMGYRKRMEKRAAQKPARLIFYRTGVSGEQFQHVKEEELPSIKAACVELGISPKITFVVVGKRSHIWFTPNENERVEKGGNCPAGLVFDTDVVHPTDFDFYLLSHASHLGTSRPTHYSVLHDENKFNADTMQAFTFALCHIHARATRSVSIPAPVYYADIVCSRAKNHFDPQILLNLVDTDTDTDTQGPGAGNYLETFQDAYKPPHARQQGLMYFS